MQRQAHAAAAAGVTGATTPAACSGRSGTSARQSSPGAGNGSRAGASPVGEVQQSPPSHATAPSKAAAEAAPARPPARASSWPESDDPQVCTPGAVCYGWHLIPCGHMLRKHTSLAAVSAAGAGNAGWVIEPVTATALYCLSNSARGPWVQAAIRSSMAPSLPLELLAQGPPEHVQPSKLPPERAAGRAHSVQSPPDQGQDSQQDSDSSADVSSPRCARCRPSSRLPACSQQQPGAQD